MHLNDSRPDLWEVIAPEEEEERQGSHGSGQRYQDEPAAMGDRLFEQRTIALAGLIEAALESFLKADEDVSRWWFCAGWPQLFMRLRHGDSSSYISPWSAPACAIG